MGPSCEQPQKKLRSSCNECHNSKSKCTGESPCQSCARLGLTCIYGPSNRMGRPRGTKNKKTLARLNSSNESTVTDAKDQMDGSQDSGTPLPRRGTSVDEDYLAVLSGIPDVNSIDGDIYGFIHPFQFTSEQHNTDGDISAFSIPRTGDVSSCSSLTDNRALTSVSKFSNDWPSAPQYALMNDSSAQSICDVAMMSDEYSQPPVTAYGHSVHDAHSCDYETPACRCLRNQTELFCTLNEFKKGSGATQVGLLLEKAPLALAHWKSALQCSHCQQVQDRDVYNMIAMGVRVMLAMMESSCTGNVGSIEQNDLACSRRSSSGSPSGSHSGSGSASPSNPRLQFGLYEVIGEDYTLVAHTLLVRNIQRIRAIMSCLRNRVDDAYSECSADRTQLTVTPLQILSTGVSTLDGTEHLPPLARSLELRAEALLQHVKARI